MEERYSSLQEEVQGKTRKLRKVWTLLHSAKSEVEDMKQEHQREMESLLEGVRQLTKELKLSTFIVDEYIPAQYQVNSLETNLFFFLRWTVFFFLFMQETIEQHVNWSEEYGEWQVKGVAYAGNNINQYKSPRSSAKSNYVSQFTFFFFFFEGNNFAFGFHVGIFIQFTENQQKYRSKYYVKELLSIFAEINHY